MSKRLDRCTQVSSPWPEALDTPVAFILIGRGGFEHGLLKKWITHTKPNGRKGPEPLVALVKEKGALFEHQGLTKLLEARPETVIVPLGLVWLPHKNARTQGPPRLRDLIRGRAGRGYWGYEKRLMLLRNPDRCALIAGEAATLGDLAMRAGKRIGANAEPKAIADFIARHATVTIDRDARAVPGAPIKLPRYAAQAILSRADFQAKLMEIAGQAGLTPAVARATAEKQLKQLIPRSNYLVISIMHKFAHFMCRQGYERQMVYDTDKAAEARDLARRHPVALLFTHKTHVDGFALVAMAMDEGFPLVHTIGGANMAFFGLGFMGRRAGGIFIRRSFGDDPIYKHCLQSYLGFVLEKRFPVAWALEGTRSRTGKLMPPRYGILKYVTDSAAQAGIDDLHLVPVSLYYDLIPDVKDYTAEQSGGTKRPESIAWFVGYLRGLRQPLGRISVAFGDPLRMADAYGPQFKDARTTPLNRLAFQASVNMNAVTPLTPSGLFAMILLAASPRAMTAAEVIKEMRQIIGWAVSRGIPVTGDFTDTDLKRIKQVAEAMMETGLVTAHDDGIEAVFRLDEEQRANASYYRNTAIHFLVQNAFMELAVAAAAEADPGQGEKAFYDAIRTARDLFKYEFFYPERESFNDQIAEELSKFDAGWRDLIKAGPEGADRLLVKVKPLMAPGTLRPFIDAYMVFADTLLRLGEANAPDGKSFVAQCLRSGKRALLQGQISSVEAVAKMPFSNAYKLAANRGLISGEVGGRVALLRELKSMQRRMLKLEGLMLQRRAAMDVGVIGVVEGGIARQKKA